MAIVLDTSIVVALAIVGEPDHDAVREWILSERMELVTTPMVMTEADYVLQWRAGPAMAEAVLADFRNGAYRVEWWPSAVADSMNVLRTEPGIGIVDASLVALAAHLRTTYIATLDERHFRQLGLAGEAFTLLPADL